MRTRDFGLGLAILMLADGVIALFWEQESALPAARVVVGNLGGALALATGLWIFTWLCLPKKAVGEPRAFVFLVTAIVMGLYWIGLFVG
ncbi:MAG: hypothetical protein ACREI3_08610 [Nitrospirales bacterium]